MPTIVVKKKYVEAFRGIYVFEDARKNLKFDLVLVVVHAVESKGLCWQPTDECILLEAISIRLHFLMWQRLERNYRNLKGSKIVNRL